MKFDSAYCQILVVAIIVGCSSASSSSKNYFTGAVFEHARQADDSPDTRISINLEYYVRAAKEAKKQGADLIVFPEYGIFPPGERKELKKSLELIPNPKEVLVTPCDEAQHYTERPILYTLSCMARNSSIVVVANMGGVEPCDGVPGCPQDGELHLNANVAFDQNGTLVGRYYKEHLFFELGMDLPLQEQDPTFDTNFGKYAMFICFDIIFKKMTEISRLVDVDAVLFSTMWLNSFPLFTSTQWFQAWSMGSNATLLAANIQLPGYLATGSGIFGGRDGSIVSTFNPDGISKLVVATIPKRNERISSISKVTAIAENYTEVFEEDGKDVPPICSYGVLGKAANIYKDYRCFSEKLSNYTLVKLNETQGHLRECNNGTCCDLDYVANSMNDSFYFGVYSGIHSPYFNRYFWYEENCFLARCDDFNGTVCSNFPSTSETLFHKISLTAHFTSNYTFPSLVSSGMKLVPVENWQYNSKHNESLIEFHSSSGAPLLLATMKGRLYDKDPPYVR